MVEARRKQSPAWQGLISAYAINHAQVCISSLGRLWRAPIASLMTAAVIAISLALPAGFFIVLENAQRLSGGWDGIARVSLYMKRDQPNERITQLVQSLRLRSEVAHLQFISADQALEEFKTRSEYGTALDALPNNPLPAVIVITPTAANAEPAALEAFAAELQQFSEVDQVQLDLQWLKRLYAIMDLIQRGLLIIASLLALGVVLVIGNTIRLDILNRRHEIQVMKLIGATAGFIRRPFLYTGFWYGLSGGIIALLLVNGGLGMLRSPVKHLAGSYNSDFQLQTFGFVDTFILLGVAISLGLLGSWLAVSRHLQTIEPGSR